MKFVVRGVCSSMWSLAEYRITVVVRVTYEDCRCQLLYCYTQILIVIHKYIQHSVF